MADPKIKYDIEAAVKGEADVNSLAQRLDDMGKVLDDDLAPAAKVAAAEMRALGQQQGAIVAFAKLSEQVRASEQDLALAQKAAKSFHAEITASGPPTAQQGALLARLNDQVKSNEAKLIDQKNALQGAGQELLKYGLTGDRLIEAQRQTSAAVDALKASVQASIPAFKAAGSEGVTSARQIQDAWGTLGIKSWAGQGTRITISLPLTLAILDGISVRVGGEIYILPLSYVVESFQPAHQDLHHLSGDGLVIRVRGEYLPVLALHELFGVTPQSQEPTTGILVVVQMENRKAALWIDEVIGQHQIVVKNLETHYRRVPNISGATILWDGSVSLIVDVAHLLGQQRNLAGA